MTMGTHMTLSFWGVFLGGEDFHWMEKTGEISVDLEKVGGRHLWVLIKAVTITGKVQRWEAFFHVQDSAVQ